MHQAQVEEGLGVAKLGGRLVQLASSGPAPVDSPPIPVAVTQLQQRIHIPLSSYHPLLREAQHAHATGPALVNIPTSAQPVLVCACEREILIRYQTHTSAISNMLGAHTCPAAR